MSMAPEPFPTKHGGPAFPQRVNMQSGSANWFGMSLRDYIAVQLAPMMTSAPDLGPDPNYEKFEREALRASLAAYAFADAMLEAREG